MATKYIRFWNEEKNYWVDVAVIDGKLSIDTPNKGFFATGSALTTAYPTGEDGWFAIVGSTDTVWVWDGDTLAWKDSGLGSLVTSVFSRSGDVVAAANDYTWAQINKATSNISDITTKSHTSLTDKGTLTHAQIDTQLGSQSKVFYVGKHGNDSNDGFTIGKAKLTIGSAMTAAGLLTPSASNLIVINILDAGIYAESYIPQQFVYLNAPMAQITGDITISDDSKINLGILNGNLTVDISKTLLCAIYEITGSVTRNGLIRGQVGTEMYASGFTANN